MCSLLLLHLCWYNRTTHVEIRDILGFGTQRQLQLQFQSKSSAQQRTKPCICSWSTALNPAPVDCAGVLIVDRGTPRVDAVGVHNLLSRDLGQGAAMPPIKSGAAQEPADTISAEDVTGASYAELRGWCRELGLPAAG